MNNVFLLCLVIVKYRFNTSLISFMPRNQRKRYANADEKLTSWGIKVPKTMFSKISGAATIQTDVEL